MFQLCSISLLVSYISSLPVNDVSTLSETTVRKRSEKDSIYSEQIRENLSTRSGNYNDEEQTTLYKNLQPRTFPIYINGTKRVISNGKRVFSSIAKTETNYSSHGIENVTSYNRKSSTQYVDRSARNEIGSPGEPIRIWNRDSTSTDVMNTARQQHYSNSDEFADYNEIISSSTHFVTDGVKQKPAKFTSFSHDNKIFTGSTNSYDKDFVKNNSSSIENESMSLSQKDTVTGTSLKPVHLHKYRYRMNHHHLRHLNLVPIEEVPFGSILWKDKKYLISILVPIGIGILGAGCIISMAYIVRFCHQHERQMMEIKQTLREGPESSTDQVILLNESDDEI